MGTLGTVGVERWNLIEEARWEPCLNVGKKQVRRLGHFTAEIREVIVINN